MEKAWKICVDKVCKNGWKVWEKGGKILKNCQNKCGESVVNVWKKIEKAWQKVCKKKMSKAWEKHGIFLEKGVEKVHKKY